MQNARPSYEETTDALTRVQLSREAQGYQVHSCLTYHHLIHASGREGDKKLLIKKQHYRPLTDYQLRSRYCNRKRIYDTLKEDPDMLRYLPENSRHAGLDYSVNLVNSLSG